MYEIFSSLLAWLYSLVHNYAIAIVLFTLFIMLVLSPLTIKSTRGMLAMSKLQPEMRKLQEKYRDDRTELNQQMMALYKEHSVSPMSGCLPLILQMPVFLILFGVLRGLTADVPKHLDHQSELFTSLCGTNTPVLMAEYTEIDGQSPPRDQKYQNSVVDLENGTASIKNDLGVEIGTAQADEDGSFVGQPIDFLADTEGTSAKVEDVCLNAIEAPLTMNAFGIDFAKGARSQHDEFADALPYYLLLFGMVGAQYFQQWQLNRRSPAPPNPQMKMIQKVMPAGFGFISIGFPAGMVLYWLTSNVFRIGQQSAMYRFDPVVKRLVVERDAAHGKISSAGDQKKLQELKRAERANLKNKNTESANKGTSPKAKPPLEGWEKDAASTGTKPPNKGQANKRAKKKRR